MRLKLVWGIAGEIMYGLEQDWTVLVIVQDNQSWYGIWSGAWLHHGLGHSKSVWGIAGEAIYGSGARLNSISNSPGHPEWSPRMVWSMTASWSGISKVGPGNYWWGHIWSGARLNSISNSPGHPEWSPRMVWDIVCEITYGLEHDCIMVWDIQSWSGELLVRPYMVWSKIEQYR